MANSNFLSTSRIITFFNAIKLENLIDLTSGDEQWDYSEEPHTARRQAILKAHPEIKQLMGYDPIISVYVILEVAIQLLICYALSIWEPHLLVLILLSYVIGAALNHSLGSAIHEIGHNLAFGHKYSKSNRVLSIIANLPMAVPFAISYKRYHTDHHRWLGHEQLDVDIPTRFESKMFCNPISKILWLTVHPLIHAIRPFFKSPKPVSGWELLNMMVQFSFDAFIFYYFGWRAIFYMTMGTIFGLGAHPLSGHFISEHYLWSDNQATHSYYGPLNILLYNVGYHVEHHDFPFIPCTRIAKVKELAPEFYDHLPYHTSWCRVVWDFIWSDSHGPKARSITNFPANKRNKYRMTEKDALLLFTSNEISTNSKNSKIKSDKID